MVANPLNLENYAKRKICLFSFFKNAWIFACGLQINRKTLPFIFLSGLCFVFEKNVCQKSTFSWQCFFFFFFEIVCWKRNKRNLLFVWTRNSESSKALHWPLVGRSDKSVVSLKLTHYVIICSVAWVIKALKCRPSECAAVLLWRQFDSHNCNFFAISPLPLKVCVEIHLLRLIKFRWNHNKEQ